MVLCEGRHRSAELYGAILLCFRPIYEDGSRRRIVQPRQELDHGRLAAAVGSDDQDELPWFDGERYLIQSPCRVLAPWVIEYNVPVKKERVSYFLDSRGPQRSETYRNSNPIPRSSSVSLLG